VRSALRGWYGFGRWLLGNPERRRARVLALGVALTAAFGVLRALNDYGDSRPWSVESDALLTALSFVNCQKYPPSLQFLLMTLGPGIVLLAVADLFPRWVAKVLTVFGRVPLFYYLLHFPLIHGIALVLALLLYGRPDWLFGGI